MKATLQGFQELSQWRKGGKKANKHVSGVKTENEAKGDEL